MARIGILTCSNATQELGCSSVSCLDRFQEEERDLLRLSRRWEIDAGGYYQLPRCPTFTGPDKLLQRIRALTDFRVDTIHFTYCMKELCSFKEKYKLTLEEAFPNIKIVVGTHEEHVTPQQYKEQVKKLFCQPRKTMVDVILNKD